jgi:CheY-like chemotaxis protein
MNEKKKIEEYLSSIRHDLRGQLLVVREGTSMALEGLGNKNCDKCFTLLRPALESADKLNKLIEELLSTSRFNTILASLFSNNEGVVRNQESGASAERMGKDELEILKRELISNDLETLKYELMNMISHLIRTPLTVVKESLSLILDEIPGKLNDKQKQLLSDATQNTDALIQSVETLFEKPWDTIADSTIDTLPRETKDRKDSSTAKNTILIVEDQAAIVDLVRMRLEANNYEVITAGDGQEGLDKARKENPDLIILDVMLPKMHGYKVCRVLKDDPKYDEIPIILATGRAPHEVRKLGKEAGADAYISKPFEAKVLLSTIKELLEKKEE